MPLSYVIFWVYIPFLISYVSPTYSFFKKKSTLEYLCQIFGNLFCRFLPDQHIS